MVFYCWDLKLLCTVKNLLHYSLTLKFHLCKEISVMHFILLLTLGPRWILDANWAASSCFQSGKTPLIFTMSFAYTKPTGFWHSTSNIARYSQVFNQHKYMVLQCNNREDIKYSSDLHSKQKQKTTTKIQKNKKQKKTKTHTNEVLSGKAFEEDITRVSRLLQQGCSFIFYFNVI